ncbi:hypothetical protein T459_21140 [Capsicum annuum]|uniref:Serine/threonine-protein phosphatase 2A activator n=1 Tax=Capsicum annuum TaxID=4072 RepID=A0A2G2YVV4_CAPAN|nr:hypothetical protein T459_21140 [Capsicum annuum]
MVRLLTKEIEAAAVELVPYFTDSFGNSSRIDYVVEILVWFGRFPGSTYSRGLSATGSPFELVPYFTDSFGTGHETNFAAWLYCLARLGVVKEEDYQALVSRVFVTYLDLMRKLQLTYCLEPAGSHGVWGLDDHHFLPFIFGSSQLIDHKYMKPKSIHNEDILENFANEYLYLSCIVFIKKVKKGVFAEHSPMLDDISGVPNWNKVNSGLLKMYKIEVLQKANFGLIMILQHLSKSEVKFSLLFHSGNNLLVGPDIASCYRATVFVWMTVMSGLACWYLD